MLEEGRWGQGACCERGEKMRVESRRKSALLKLIRAVKPELTFGTGEGRS